ncbi:MAG: hypothetical protein R3D98_03285 [Candidatus Krumholzibacteriia bacterium]
MTRSLSILLLTVVLAGAAAAQQRLAVFAAAGPGAPDPAVLAEIDAAVRRELVLGLDPEAFVTLMADQAAPGCTGRCAVRMAAEYGATLALAVRVDLQADPRELELTVYAAPAGATLARRQAESASAAGLVDLAGRTAAALSAALMGQAPGLHQAVITDPAGRPAAPRRGGRPWRRPPASTAWAWTCSSSNPVARSASLPPDSSTCRPGRCRRLIEPTCSRPPRSPRPSGRR